MKKEPQYTLYIHGIQIKELAVFDLDLISRLKKIFINRKIPNSIIIDNLPNSSILLGDSEQYFQANDPILRYVSTGKNNFKSVDDIIGEGGLIYNNSKYLFRKSQYDMAKSIEKNINNDTI